jgi:hypothetical protein
MMGRASLALVLVAWPLLAQEASDYAPDSALTPPARAGEVEQPAEEASEEAPAGEEPEVDSAGADESGEDERAPPESEDRLALSPPEEVPAEEAPTDDVEGDPSAAVSEEPGAGEAPTEETSDEAPAGPPQRDVLTETSKELAACLAELDEIGVTYERSEPITEPDDPDCGMANPVTVSALAPGVALEPPSAMRCATALAGARWVADIVVPLSRKLGRGDLVAVDQGTAYLCRPRADGEMSEHAWGNALDIMGFRFADGEAIVVQPRAGDGTIEEAFQRVVRAGACLDFATVLGPGSDTDHADHLHFDIKARNGGFRICE